MTVDDLTPQEIAAALAARRELGPDYEREIAQALAERMERRIDSEVAARTGGGEKSASSPRRGLGVLAPPRGCGALALAWRVLVAGQGPDSAESGP